MHQEYKLTLTRVSELPMGRIDRHLPGPRHKSAESWLLLVHVLLAMGLQVLSKRHGAVSRQANKGYHVVIAMIGLVRPVP